METQLQFFSLHGPETIRPRLRSALTKSSNTFIFLTVTGVCTPFYYQLFTVSADWVSPVTQPINDRHAHLLRENISQSPLHAVARCFTPFMSFNQETVAKPVHTVLRLNMPHPFYIHELSVSLPGPETFRPSISFYIHELSVSLRGPETFRPSISFYIHEVSVSLRSPETFRPSISFNVHKVPVSLHCPETHATVKPSFFFSILLCLCQFQFR